LLGRDFRSTPSDKGDKVRIAYVTTYDANDRLQWSGLGNAILESLRAQGIDVTSIGPLRQRFRWIGRVKRRLYGQFLGQIYDFEREALVAWDYAQQVSAQLSQGNFDVVFSPGTIPISRLHCPQPIVIWADATFGALTELYDESGRLCAETLRAGHRTERVALRNCALTIFASDWAAESAIHQYGADPDKVKVIPFGANFLEAPSYAQVVQSIHDRETATCQLITIGVDWIRKGIPRAIELAAALNARGLPTRLTVVGCPPPADAVLPDFVNIVGFIDKRSPEGERRLSRLLEQSHFHVLFSIAECFGVVFAEANAHAVPNIANDIGGIGSVVINGRGGQRFSPTVPIDQVANYVLKHFRDRGAYAELAMSARREYDERLNWQIAGAEVARYLKKLM
jgi:glycosyltransferase involved in cell wall biosynthesis